MGYLGDEIAHYMEHCSKLSAENKQLREENGRLREELEDSRDLWKELDKEP